MGATCRDDHSAVGDRLPRRRAAMSVSLAMVLAGWVGNAACSHGGEQERLGMTEAGKLRLGCAIFALQFSPDVKVLAAAGDKRIGLWLLAQEKRFSELAAGDRFTSLAFSPDGAHLAAGQHCSPATRDGSYTGRLWVWEAAKGKVLQQKPLEEPVLSVAFSPDGKSLACGLFRGGVVLWSLREGRPLRQLHHGPHPSVAFSRDGGLLASGSNPPEPTFVPAVGPDGAMIAPAGRPVGEDGTIRLWDPATGKMIREMAHKSSEGATSLAFSPSANILAAGYEDGAIRLWDTATGNLLRSLEAHTRPSWALPIAFSPDGKLLASGAYQDQDTHLSLWDVATGKRLSSVSAAPLRITSIAFSSDGQTIAVADCNDSDGVVRLWRLTGGPAVAPGQR